MAAIQPRQQDAFSDEEWYAYLDSRVERCKPSSSRKQDRSRQREKEILNAAMRVFARDGLSASRISDIAAEAGIPVSTIYEYYAGKEDIAHAVPVANLCRFFEEYRALVEKKSSAYEYVWHFLYLSVDFARRNPDWARALYLEIWPSVTVTQGDLKDMFDDYTRILLYALRMGTARGEWDGEKLDYYETASILVGAVNQVIVTWLLMRKPKDINKATAKMLDRAMTLLDPVNPPNR